VAGRAAALLPPSFFAAAVGFFAAALTALPVVMRDLAEHFYQAHVLAVTHMLTLGWISMAMLGVLYRYLPGLTKHPLPAPRLAVVQWVTFVAGVLGLVVHFWLGRWMPTLVFAGVLLLSTTLLCVNVWPLLLGAPARGVAEIGVLAATGCFVAAAALGTLIAADKTYSFLPGSTITNLSAHAHLAALGWVALTVCALSFRFLPAFLLPTLDLARPALRQVSFLAGAVILLVVALLGRSRWIPLAALVVAASLVAYLVLVGRLVASRRMPLDWTVRHALASVVWCALTVAAGVTLALLGTDTPFGARLAGAYGVAALLGWLSNLLIGMSYKLFPGFVVAARTQQGRPPVPLASVSVRGDLQPAVFLAFNAGLTATMVGLLLALPAVLAGGALVTALGGLVYAAATFRTLAFTLVDPRRPARGLAVLP
jgi:hypothetical protein